MVDIKDLINICSKAGQEILKIYKKTDLGIEYKKDNSGKLVTSQLNEKILEEIAEAGRGAFIRFNNKPANYKNILNQIDSMEKRTVKSHVYSEFEEQYQKFGILSLCLMIASMLISTRKN